VPLLHQFLNKELPDELGAPYDQYFHMLLKRLDAATAQNISAQRLLPLNGQRTATGGRTQHPAAQGCH
jgi:hypothetical protein